MTHKIEYSFGPMRSLFLPIFNVGQLIFAAIVIILVVLVLLANNILGIYLLIGVYVGAVVSSSLLGLSPCRTTISSNDCDILRSILDRSDNLVKLSVDTWSIRKYQGNIWRSDRIWINTETSKIELFGRCRDLHIIVRQLSAAHNGDVL